MIWGLYNKLRVGKYFSVRFHCNLLQSLVSDFTLISKNNSSVDCLSYVLRKTVFANAKPAKAQVSCEVTAQLISALGFHYIDNNSSYFDIRNF